MKLVLASLLLLTAFFIMRSNTETLVPEDTTVSATALPLDLANSATGFETATFGMG